MIAEKADKYFHPHGFTLKTTEEICSYSGKDVYYGVFCDDSVIGYGLLRGWDEGYLIPSLGIAILSEYRSSGLAKALMFFLHFAAKMKGASQIRLSVENENIAAYKLYSNLGYIFTQKNDEKSIGFLDL